MPVIANDVQIEFTCVAFSLHRLSSVNCRLRSDVFCDFAALKSITPLSAFCCRSFGLWCLGSRRGRRRGGPRRRAWIWVLSSRVQVVLIGKAKAMCVLGARAGDRVPVNPRAMVVWWQSRRLEEGCTSRVRQCR